MKGASVWTDRVAARGHATFGAPDTTGRTASRMAKRRSSDGLDPAHLRSWAKTVAGQLEGP